MAKQYTIDELFTNDKLVVRVDSKEEWDRVNEVAGKRGMTPIHMVCFEDAQRIDGKGGVCLHCSKKDNHVWWASTDYYLGEDYTIVPCHRVDFSIPDKEVTGDSRYMIIIDCVDDVTTAKMIVDGKEVRVGTAKRNPADQFDFAVGARYAFDRLWEKQPKENETKRLSGFKIGDRVKYIGEEGYINYGKIGTVRDFRDEDIGVEFDDNVDGHNLSLGEIGCSCEKGHGWWCAPKSLTKITEEVKPRKGFKVGTRVKYIGVGKPTGLRGTICVCDDNLPGVAFDKKFGGHDLDFGGSGPKCKDGHGWWCWTSDLEEITEE